MKKATLTTLVLLVSFAFLGTKSLMAQEVKKEQVSAEKDTKKVEKDKANSFEWDKSKHVFGSIEHKKPVVAEFTFTNNTNESVAVTKVGTTCGCTSPSYPKEPIKPGEKGTVKLRFDAVAPGFFQKAAKIHFTDGTAKELEIEGKVVVRKSDIK